MGVYTPHSFVVPVCAARTDRRKEATSSTMFYARVVSAFPHVVLLYEAQNYTHSSTISFLFPLAKEVVGVAWQAY